LRGELIKEGKKNKMLTDIDTAEPEIIIRDDQKYRIDEDLFDMSIFMDKLIDKIKDDLNADDLSDNEFKIGHSLIKILEEWETLFADSDDRNSPKFNKNLILLYIRNITGLSTKEIRNSMKRFKSLYSMFKNEFIEE
jgi:hypothetical protein